MNSKTPRQITPRLTTCCTIRPRRLHPRNWASRLLITFGVVFGLGLASVSLHAQAASSSASPASSSSADSANGPLPATASIAPAAIAAGELTPGDPNFVPLTGSQRWNRFASGYLGSPYTYLAAAGAATGGFITHAPKDPANEWGRNLGGYGRRVGTEFATFTIHVGVHEGGDAALGLDPRYFRCQCTGFGPRMWNALQFTVLAYDSNGHKRLDLPQFAGAYGSAMITRLWYPDHYSPLVQGVQAGHIEMGLVFVANILREYRPELSRASHAINPFKRR